MRLTLRTLLAYMDEILEPRDAQEIGRRIADSDFVTGLLHRIRDVTRRLWPPGDVVGRDAGLDPNTIAEYLDNTMPPDRVPDFEKVCLENDAHLAELASCHQILTLVLGEPAEVDPDSRQRMYRLPEKLAEEKKTEPSDKAPAGGDGQLDGPVAATVRPDKQEIPEYLREPRRRRWWIAAAVVLMTLLVLVVLSLTGQFERGTLVGNMLRWGIGIPTMDGKRVAVRTTAPVVTAGTAHQEVATGSRSTAPAPRAGHEAIYPGREATGRKESAATEPSEPVSAEPASSGATSAVPAPVEPKPTEPKQDSVEPAMAGSGQKAPATGPAIEKPASETAETASPPTRVATLPDRPSVEKPSSQPPLPRVAVGQYVSATEVLLKLDPQSHWQRVPGQLVLNDGDQVLSLPAFRPSITLNNGIGLQLVDGTQAVFLPLDKNGLAGIDIHFGRLVVKAGQQKKARLRLQFGERNCVVAFADSDSVLMVDVYRSGDAIADPETQPGPLVADLFTAAGTVLWQAESGQEPIAMPASMRLLLDENPPKPAVIQELPSWGSPESVAPLDQRASPTLERALTPDRMVLLSLRELASVNRQREVRWLATRCLGYLGDFELLVKALDDPEQKLVWVDHTDQLCQALQRSPQSAGQVRATMESLFKGDGTTLYELLWKYRKQKFDQEEAARLIDLLEHPVLAVRVLSFWNLREATGMSLYYRPEYPAAKRLPCVQRWRERMGVRIGGTVGVQQDTSNGGGGGQVVPPFPGAAEQD